MKTLQNKLLKAIPIVLLAFLPIGQAKSQNYWTPDTDPFDNYMTITGYLMQNGQEVQSDQMEIGCFIDNECRGIFRMRPMPYMGHPYSCFLAVWGNASDNGKPITVKVFDHATNTVSEAVQKPVYTYNGDLGFENPYELTLSAAKTHAVNISAMPNGTVTASPTKPAVAENETVTLTITPAAGYALDAITACKTGETATTVQLSGTGNTRTFTMPAFNVTVTATFKKTADQIAIEAARSLIEGSSYFANQTSAGTSNDMLSWLVTQLNDLLNAGGSGITVTAADITVSGFTPAVAGTPGTPAGTNGAFTFTVLLTQGGSSLTTTPTSGTIIATPYVAPTEHAISISGTTNGTVTANPVGAPAGTTVTLTITPSAGYELDAISVSKTGDASTTVNLSGTDNTRTFTMPPYEITITATFKMTADRTALETAKALIENSNYSADQASENDEASLKTWLVTQINNLLNGSGITVTAADITISGLSSAAEGTAGTPAGTNGLFTFTVNLTKGGNSLTTTGNTVAIIATPYIAPPEYSVTIAATTNGMVTTNLASAPAGTTVMLTITPATGYELEAISACKTGDAATPVSLSGSNNTRTFTMPAYGVTINATFKTTQSPYDDQSAVIAAKSAIESKTFRIPQAAGNTPETVQKWLVDTLNIMFGQSHNIQLRSAADPITGEVILTSLTPAVAGTEKAPNGTNGSFQFIVSLSKGVSMLTAGVITGEIIATPYSLTGNDKIDQPQLQAWTQNGILHVSSLKVGERWSVYTLAGSLIHRSIAADKNATITLPGRGMYLIHSDNRTVKVINE